MKKILIIEDEFAYQQILKNELVGKGYTVVEAIDGKKGLEMAESEKPDLIILDIRMPIMDGMTMLGLLRKEEWGKKIKVVVLTNLEPNDKILENVVTDEPSYYFIKSDIKLDELLAKTKDLLGEQL